MTFMEGPGKSDRTKLEPRVLKMTLEKFWGEKVPGDGKEPYEIIEGGDGLPTMMIRENGVDLEEPRELHGVDLADLGSKPESKGEKT